MVSSLLELIFGTTTAVAQVFTGPGVVDGVNEVSGVGGISTEPSLIALIVEILVIALDFVTLLGVVAIVIAGLYLITGNGDEGQKDKAKKIIQYTIVGILVVLFSRVIVTFVATIV